jgi:hypothetical protein
MDTQILLLKLLYVVILQMASHTTATGQAAGFDFPIDKGH